MQNTNHSMRVGPTGNIIRRGDVYHLLMLVNGQWLETGITSRGFMEITDIADREFATVMINAPLSPQAKAQAA
jgi:hypothetical protein